MERDPVPCDLVVFAAHPDDAELTCGGTLALCAARGSRAGVVDFTRGELGSRGTAEIRDEEAAAAGRILGLACRVNLGLPDGGLRDDDAARERIVRLIRILRPRVVIAPPLVDHHPDHMAVAEILTRSFYLAGIGRYAQDAPAWRPSVLLHHCNSRNVSPAIVVDIGETIDVRRKAIACYRSQFHREGSTEPATRISHPAFLDALEGTCRHYGALIGVQHGEGFIPQGPVPVADLVALYSRTPWEHPTRATETSG